MKKFKELSASFSAVIFILFWLLAAGLKLVQFNQFKEEINNQVFPPNLSNVLVYTIPVLEIIIAGLLVWYATRLAGMVLGLMLMLAFSTYVGLAVLNAFSKSPCICAGLLGNNSSWRANLIVNLVITAVAAIGLIITLKDKERRKQGMRTMVSTAPLPA